MADFLSIVLNASILVFAIASMMAAGFSYTIKEILIPLGSVRTVLRLLIANFLLVPLLGYFILQVMSLDRPLEIGLFLIATAAGAPFLIKLTATARQNVAVSAGLLMVLVPATILYMPLVVPVALPNAEVDPLSIATPLVLSMLLPLIFGIAIKALANDWAVYLQPYMSVLSSVALIVLIVSTFAVNFNGIVNLLGEGAVLAAMLLIFGAFVIGYLSGGLTPENREEFGLATAQRNIAAATVVATQTVGHPDTLNMVVIASLVGLAILFSIAWSMSKNAPMEGGPKSPSEE